MSVCGAAGKIAIAGDDGSATAGAAIAAATTAACSVAAA
jgi:hypothetical protein